MMKDSSRIIDNVFLLEEWKPATKIRSTLLFSTTFLFSFEWLIFLSPLLIFTFPKGPILEMKNHTVKKLVKIEKCLIKKKITHTNPLFPSLPNTAAAIRSCLSVPVPYL